MGISAGIYWRTKRKPLPRKTAAIWVVWAVVEVLSIAGSLMHRA